LRYSETWTEATSTRFQRYRVAYTKAAKAFFTSHPMGVTGTQHERESCRKESRSKGRRCGRRERLFISGRVVRNSILFLEGSQALHARSSIRIE
jgi:hypothetical protein